MRLHAVEAATAPEVEFAHPSERAFARLLDFYAIRWDYEPRTFVLERAADGRPLEAFTPDFHLVDLDLYIEVTTLRQALVTAKNRKVRRLRALHPEVEVKILYRRDCERLALKYGLADDEDLGLGRRPGQRSA